MKEIDKIDFKALFNGMQFTWNAFKWQCRQAKNKMMKDDIFKHWQKIRVDKLISDEADFRQEFQRQRRNLYSDLKTLYTKTT